LVLQACFIAECIAPPVLHASRFLPATPIRIAIDHQGRDLTADPAFTRAKLTPGDPTRTVENETVRHKLLPTMLGKAQQLAEAQLKTLQQRALTTMRKHLDDEIARLEDLQTRNPQVRPEEITAFCAQREALASAIQSTALRLDAVRLVLRLK
jgi:ATP-dependent helicase HepA